MGHRQTPELLPGWPIFYRRNNWQVCGCRQWSTTHLLLQRLWGSCTSRWNRKPVQKFFYIITQHNSDTHNICTIIYMNTHMQILPLCTHSAKAYVGRRNENSIFIPSESSWNTQKKNTPGACTTFWSGPSMLGSYCQFWFMYSFLKNYFSLIF